MASRSGLALVLGLALAPAPTRACSSHYPGPGLVLNTHMLSATTSTDGVIAVTGTLFEADLAETSASLSVSLSAPGESIPATIELRAMNARFALDWPLWDVVIVIRPEQPLTAGARYSAEVFETIDGVSHSVDTVDVTVTDGPLGPLPAPAPEVRVEALSTVREYVCCESTPDSCGDESHCFATSHDNRPALHVAPLTLPDPVASNALVWVARVGEGGALERLHEALSAPFTLGWDVVFDAAQPEYCVVVGLTSLVDGSSVEAEPYCSSAEAFGAPSITTTPIPGGFFDLCLTPPVHEDGSPYVAEGGGGCSIDRVAAPWSLLLLLAMRRRRRAKIA